MATTNSEDRKEYRKKRELKEIWNNSKSLINKDFGSKRDFSGPMIV